MKLNTNILIHFFMLLLSGNIQADEISKKCLLQRAPGHRFEDYGYNSIYEFKNFIKTDLGAIVINDRFERRFKRVPFIAGDIISSIDDCDLRIDSQYIRGFSHKLIVSMIYPKYIRVKSPKFLIYRNLDKFEISGINSNKINKIEDTSTKLIFPENKEMKGIWDIWQRSEKEEIKLEIKYRNSITNLNFNNKEISKKYGGDFRVICNTEGNSCLGYDEENKPYIYISMFRFIEQSPPANVLRIRLISDDIDKFIQFYKY